MIHSTLRAFLEQPVMMVIAVGETSGGAALGRCLGLRLPVGDGAIEIVFSAWQWPDLARSAGPGRAVALTLVHPSTYRTYQLKGRIEAVCEGDAEDMALADDYIGRMIGMLGALGVERDVIDRWCGIDAVTRVAIRADDLFDQTPGPRAGERIPA
jgi:hypothetical protein